jgi:tetratricopeptide (TPR) repeat protein
MRKSGLLILLVICFFIPSQVYAQLVKRDARRLARAEKYYEALKFDEAEELLLPLSKKYPYSSSIWNLLAQVQVRNYYQRSQKDMIFALSRRDSSNSLSTSERTRRDSLDKIFIRLMNEGRPSKRYMDRSVNCWREATLKCADAEFPSTLLRTFLLDPVVSDIPSDSSTFVSFSSGEEAFQKQNFADAISAFEKTVTLDSTCFKAWISLGNAYYFNRDYLAASHAFRRAVSLRPGLQEPRKYLVDALYHLHSFDEAQEEAIQALIIYPETSMFLKLEEVAKARHKSFDRHWTERIVFPNTVGDQPLNEKGDRDWMEYINGFSLVEKFCNKDGIITQKNNLTKSPYAEVFSWEYMLRKTGSEKFPFARKMQQEGYLDCYVMLSEYHIDFNAQYQDFAKRNKERIKSYLELLMNQ